MLFMSLGLIISLINVNWSNVDLKEELDLPILLLLLSIYYIIYYIRILKNKKNVNNVA
jgi:hypothetical protein